MGRNIKKGLEYYPMDVDIVSDMKIRKLIKQHKGHAFAVYTLLLCCIYKNGYYINWDDDLPFILAEQTGFTEKYILSVINYCVSIGLFSEELYQEHRILTSLAIQERYLCICRQGKRKCPIDEYSLITTMETPPQVSAPSNVESSPFIPSSPTSSVSVRSKDLYTELCQVAEVREDVWDAASITGSFVNENTLYYQQWLAMDDTRRKQYPLHQLNAYLRQYCVEVNTEWYHAIYWCRDNLLASQFSEVNQILTAKPPALFELQKLIKEVDKGKINNPGLFILKNLRLL